MSKPFMFNIPGDESCKLNFLAPSITSFKQNYALCVVLQAIIDPKGRVYQINSRAGSHCSEGEKRRVHAFCPWLTAFYRTSIGIKMSPKASDPTALFCRVSVFIGLRRGRRSAETLPIYLVAPLPSCSGRESEGEFFISNVSGFVSRGS